jgi:hypothetical protein
MSDTYQVLSWSLEQECPFRRGSGWQLPMATRRAVEPIRSYSNAPLGSISGDVLVTGWSFSKAGTKPRGIRISEALAPFGGLAAAHETCAGCKANVWSDPFSKMGGCAGEVGLDPDSHELASALDDAIRSKSLQSSMANAFRSTKPLWYGLWINSPLTTDQCRLILAILTDLSLLKLNDRRILLALDVSITHGLPMHVWLSPLGHTDFGVNTVFPHCPRCRAFAGFRWRSPYPSDPTTCGVCGNIFSPAQTASTERLHSPAATELTDSEVAAICKTMAPPSHPRTLFGLNERK